jgi:hypothetical protein
MDIVEHSVASGSTATYQSAAQDNITDSEQLPAMELAMSTCRADDNADYAAMNEDMANPDAAAKEVAECLVASQFMNSPSQETLDKIVADFIDATGNQALKTVACGACARESIASECTETPLKDIPNRHLLTPHTAHAAHELVDNLLIYAPGLGASKKTMHLCNECHNQLKKNVRPRLSLSNDMWIGEIPRELQILTLSERLLLAKYFPSAYIVKLFPKQKNAHAWDRSQMHSGLKGNVSTYRLDPHQVASMIDGKWFPPPAKILSATIGITFIGPKGLRESTMPAIFRVRRWRVREALRWLKANNPLYTDIEISEERLSELPEDGIPEELTMTAKHSTDTGSLEREHGDYVPTDAADDEGQ